MSPENQLLQLRDTLVIGCGSSDNQYNVCDKNKRKL